jgi:hypothetical protein
MTLAGDAPPGFAATKPLGTWNKQLGVDCPGVFKAIAKSDLPPPHSRLPEPASRSLAAVLARPQPHSSTTC